MWIIENWETILFVIAGIVAAASAVAKVTPNETDNKYVAKAQKVVDFLAMTTGKTKLKDKKLNI